jgi:hypothetical protein
MTTKPELSRCRHCNGHVIIAMDAESTRVMHQVPPCTEFERLMQENKLRYKLVEVGIDLDHPDTVDLTDLKEVSGVWDKPHEDKG